MGMTLVMDRERVLAVDIHAVWPQTRYLPSKRRAAIDAPVVEIRAMIGYRVKRDLAKSDQASSPGCLR